MQALSRSPWVMWAARLCFAAPLVVFVVSVYQLTSTHHTERRAAHAMMQERSPQIALRASVPAPDATVATPRRVTLVEDDSQALDDARLALAASDPLVRAEGAAELASIGTYVIVPELMLAATHDADARVREEAVLALAEIAKEDAVPILTEALQDPDAEVRRTALAQLGEMDSPAAERVLRLTAADTRHSMHTAAAQTLADR